MTELSDSPHAVSFTEGRGTPFQTRKTPPLSSNVPAFKFEPRSGIPVATTLLHAPPDVAMGLEVLRDADNSTQLLALAHAWSPGQPCGRSPPLPLYKITSTLEAATEYTVCSPRCGPHGPFLQDSGENARACLVSLKVARSAPSSAVMVWAAVRMPNAVVIFS